jgi:hypothetical protein
MSRTCFAASGPSALPGVRNCGAAAGAAGGVAGVVASAGGASGGFGSMRGASRLGAGRGLLAGTGTVVGNSPTGSGLSDSGRGAGSIARGGGSGTSNGGRSAGAFACAEAHADASPSKRTNPARLICVPIVRLLSVVHCQNRPMEQSQIVSRPSFSIRAIVAIMAMSPPAGRSAGIWFRAQASTALRRPHRAAARCGRPSTSRSRCPSPSS